MILNDSLWRSHLADALTDQNFARLQSELEVRKQAGAVIYPPDDRVFAAFNLTPFDKVRVVILGQDPYHGPGQAMGLSFSVPAGIRKPPSLKNILKEIQADIGKTNLRDGDLTPWAYQGVFLLNTALTVEEGKAGAHAKLGWSAITDAAVEALSRERDHLVFLLWGAHAQKKQALVDTDKHLVLTAVHPSPLSAHRGFFGCRHFSKANSWLEMKGLAPVHW